MSHTPGPWRVHQHHHINDELWLSIGWHTYEGTSNPDGRWIGPVAELKYLVAREDEQWANAHLISAAPELLEALRLAENYVHLWMQDNTGEKELADLQQIEDAIAKAEGKTP